MKVKGLSLIMLIMAITTITLCHQEFTVDLWYVIPYESMIL
ncbi:MAG TPA: hypothetical protein VI754_06530 [Bacteriovoracaceae bacterium]|nr:hypothetical protein [Bacteriovoracaceae bacterium]